MVYRGKPSAGCDACRKAKKRCDLEQPSCTRCRKLKKPCSGYRDTSQLLIHDESESVRIKAERHKAPVTILEKSVTHRPKLKASTLSSPESSSGTSSSPPSDDLSRQGIGPRESAIHNEEFAFGPIVHSTTSEDALKRKVAFNVPASIKPSSDDAATAFFFSQFTSENGQWLYLRDIFKGGPSRLLDLSVRACGVAALENIRGVGVGLSKSRSLYAEALRYLNSGLRDPVRCRNDENLIAVHLLGMYENLTCDSRESIMSWKAHVAGSQKLLQIRGKGQFKSYIGRQLFRENRAQILVHAIWDDLECPKFLHEWDYELRQHSHPFENHFMNPGDNLGLICLEYATLRYQFRTRVISDADTMNTARAIEVRLIQWSIDTMGSGPAWSYGTIKVPESPHVWNKTVHSYSGLSVIPSIWNIYRSIRIMLTRTQEQVLRRFGLPAKAVEAQLAYLKDVRRQQADDICGSMPTQLGHADPARNSPCVLISAYGSVWPLFFAGTCALERADTAAWKRVLAGNPLNEDATSATTAQASWIIGRLEYISKHLGMRWADGLAATLNGDFQKYHNIPIEGQKPPDTPDPWRKKLHESDLGPMMMKKWRATIVEYGILEAQDAQPKN